MKKLAIIVPAYNEEASIAKTAECLRDILNQLISAEKISQDSFICFVNDGSKDKTSEEILKVIEENKNVKLIEFSRNFGQQNAILAGFFNTDADAYVSIDVDLQEDETAILEMVEKFNNGADIVYGVRSDRSSDNFFKKYSAELFYKFMNLLNINLVYNHSEYRLMSRRAIEELKKFNEKNIFLKALIPLLGFKQEKVFYKRKARFAGETKYSPQKLFALAWEGITSFSTKPLQIAIWAGIFAFFISLLFLGYAIFLFFADGDIEKFEIILGTIFFLSGTQLLSIGILGEYIGKIYKETKNRPNYIIEKQI